MNGQTRERWETLCALAATEKNPDKLLALVKEINAILEEKEERLKRTRASETTSMLGRPN